MPLDSKWEFREARSSNWLPASVPGSVFSDLEANKKNEKIPKSIASLYRASWEYRTKFDVPSEVLEQDVVRLCFKGLGSDADVYLNDSLVLTADNRFRSWVINCKSVLKAKDNILMVHFYPSHKIKKDSSVHGHKSGHKGQMQGLEANEDLFDNVGCENWLSAMGIWRPVFLQAWSTANVEDIYLRPDSITPKRAVYTVFVSINSVANQIVNLEIFVNNESQFVPKDITLSKGLHIFHTQIVLDKPKLWFANGLGDPNLYHITLRLKREHQVIAEARQRFGVRTIEMVKKTGTSDKGFYFKLNGIPIFVKGATYVDDCRRDDAFDSQEQAIENARASNFNMIRFSGAYGDDSFYDLCDENGILVWQDFSANFLKPNTDHTFDDNDRQEAIENLKRLRNHPSLALWCGDDLPLTSDSVNIESNSKEAGDSDIFQKKLPKLVDNYGFPVGYLNMSECIDKDLPVSIDILNGRLVGNIVTSYGVPSYGYVKFRKNFSDKNLTYRPHIQDNIATKYFSDYVQKNFNAPKDTESEAYMTWITQSELLKSTVENHRIHMPRCMGTLFNRINDCTGGFSDATFDSSFWWKPAQYAIREAFSHILVVPVREHNSVNIYGVSDAFRDLDVFLLVRLTDFYGNTLFVKQIPVELKANSSNILLTLKESELLKNVDVTKCCLVAQINQANRTLSQNILYFTELKNLYQPRSAIDFEINEAVKGYNLILRSHVLVKNLVISTNSKKCWLSDNNIDLLPGKRMKINIRYNGTRAELERDISFKSLADLK
jgi:beta-mannosidase